MTGTLTINETTDATSSTSAGSVIVNGGVAIKKSVHIATTLDVEGTTQATSASTGALTVAGGTGVAGNVPVGGTLNVTGNVTLSGTGNSVGTITSGTWNGGTIAVNRGGTGLTSYTATRILYASGSTTITGSANLTFNGTTFTSLNISASATTASTSTATGSLITAGGLGVAGAANIGTDLTVSSVNITPSAGDI